jgi:hypothetical protein
MLAGNMLVMLLPPVAANHILMLISYRQFLPVKAG